MEVCSLGGHLCSLSVEPTAAAIVVKAAIEAVTGIPVVDQRLLRGTAELLAEDAVGCGSHLAHGKAEAAEAEAVASLTLLRRSPEQAQWLDRIRRNPLLFPVAPHAVKMDPEVVIAAVAKGGHLLRFAAAELKHNRSFICSLAAVCCTALAFAAEGLRSDREVVLAAVANDGRSLAHAANELRHDKEVVMTAVSSRGAALEFASEDLRGDRDVVLIAVSNNGLALQHATEELRGDRSIVMPAVAQNGEALQHASVELKADRFVSLVATTSSRRRAATA